MHDALHQLARELGIDDAALLRLAREAACDHDVRSIHDLTEDAAAEVISALLRLHDAGLVGA